MLRLRLFYAYQVILDLPITTSYNGDSEDYRNNNLKVEEQLSLTDGSTSIMNSLLSKKDSVDEVMDKVEAYIVMKNTERIEEETENQTTFSSFPFLQVVSSSNKIHRINENWWQIGVAETLFCLRLKIGRERRVLKVILTLMPQFRVKTLEQLGQYHVLHESSHFTQYYPNGIDQLDQYHQHPSIMGVFTSAFYASLFHPIKATPCRYCNIQANPYNVKLLGFNETAIAGACLCKGEDVYAHTMCIVHDILRRKSSTCSLCGGTYRLYNLNSVCFEDEIVKEIQGEGYPELSIFTDTSLSNAPIVSSEKWDVRTPIDERFDRDTFIDKNYYYDFINTLHRQYQEHQFQADMFMYTNSGEMFFQNILENPLKEKCFWLVSYSSLQSNSIEWAVCMGNVLLLGCLILK